MTKKLLMGNEAFAHAALEAGVRVVAGYPGTPSSELIETVAAERAAGRAQGVHVEWSTNEKAALELLAGAAYCGARVLFTCKQVGLNVASDALMSLNYVGVKGGTVLFVADDPGPISSQTEQDTRRFAAFAKVPVLDPATPEQGFAMMQAAFDLSERYRTPGYRAAHHAHRPRLGVSSTWPTKLRRAPCRKKDSSATPGGSSFRSAPSTRTGKSSSACAPSRMTSRPTRRWPRSIAVRGRRRPAGEALPAGEQRPRLGIMAGGVSAAYAREALRMLEGRAAAEGARVPAYRFMQVGTPYPFPEEAVASFTEGLDRILVLEELDHVLEDALLAFAGKTHAPFDVRGEADRRCARPRGKRRGRHRRAHRTLLRASPPAPEPLAYEASDDAPLPVRPPVLCAGWPAPGQLLCRQARAGRAAAVLCGDIGCYTLGNAKPLDAVDTCLCMGAGITMARARGGRAAEEAGGLRGDSTFFASGLTGIVNAVYNVHDITIAVLDNATTAMTGSQPHPGTGVTLMGAKRRPVSIEGMLRAMGVECIVRANPLALAEAQAAAREAIDFEGPSAILFESPCIQLKRPGPAAEVDAGRCTGCKKCIAEIGCPGIGFSAEAQGPKSGARGQAFVDASLCNGCGLCVQICPFGALGEGGAHD